MSRFTRSPYQYAAMVDQILFIIKSASPPAQLISYSCSISIRCVRAAARWTTTRRPSGLRPMPPGPLPPAQRSSLRAQPGLLSPPAVLGAALCRRHQAPPARCSMPGQMQVTVSVYTSCVKARAACSLTTSLPPNRAERANRHFLQRGSRDAHRFEHAGEQLPDQIMSP